LLGFARRLGRSTASFELEGFQPEPEEPLSIIKPLLPKDFSEDEIQPVAAAEED
jgi:hypothetical protein